MKRKNLIKKDVHRRYREKIQGKGKNLIKKEFDKGRNRENRGKTQSIGKNLIKKEIDK